MSESHPKWDAFQAWKRERFLPSDVSADGPLVIPGFRQDMGYKNITIGNIGSGQSYATGLQMVEYFAVDELPNPVDRSPLIDTLAFARQKS